MRVIGDRAHLRGRVHGAQFRGLGDADGERLSAMLVTPPPCFLVDQVGCQLAIGRGHSQQLEAADSLRRAILIGVKMSG